MADPNAASAATLVDEWVRHGLTHAALAPGSRSTPLALALAAHGVVQVEVVLDERSAAFFALGAAKASGRPALVLSTSGTAAANFHPAVLEASHARVPLLVCTADRPPELRGVGAPQTTDQVGMFGKAVRAAFDLTAEGGPAASASWRPLAARAFAAAVAPPAGPVHLNLGYREPLVPAGGVAPGASALVPADGIVPVASALVPSAGPAASTAIPEGLVEGLAAEAASTPRGLIVAGWGTGVSSATLLAFGGATGWPVLADGASNVWAPGTVDAYEALVRAPAFAGAHRPDLILRLGAPLTSKATNEFLDTAGGIQVLVDPAGVWLDPAGSATQRVVAEPAALLAALTERIPAGRGGNWAAAWQEAGAVARAALDAHLAAAGPLEGLVARDLTATLPAGATLVVGSSMPIRDVDAFAVPRHGLTILSNRGLNGIDGFTSTVCGVAAAAAGPVAGLCGDLTFLHDGGGLWAAARTDRPVVLVVVDNGGGGIFSFLPQAEALPTDRFEALFGTPHGVDLVAVARSAGVHAERIDGTVVAEAARDALAGGGFTVLVTPTGSRTANAAAHGHAWAAATGATERWLARNPA